MLIGTFIDHFGVFGGEKFPLDAKKVHALLSMFDSIYLFYHKKWKVPGTFLFLLIFHC
jgi:transporter family-2 protein